MSDFDPVSFDRECPFCAGRVTVTYADANFGARACNFFHVHGGCEQWRAALRAPDTTADGGTLVRACNLWAGEAHKMVAS